MYVGSRQRVATDPRPDPPDYGMVDLRAVGQIGRHFGLIGDIRNLLDTDAEEPSFGNSLPADMQLPEQTYFVSMGASW